MGAHSLHQLTQPEIEMMTLIHAQELLIENLRRLKVSYSKCGLELGGRAARARRAAISRFFTTCYGLGYEKHQIEAAANDAYQMFVLEEAAE